MRPKRGLCPAIVSTQSRSALRKAKWNIKQLYDTSGQGRRCEQQGDRDCDLPSDEDVSPASLTSCDATIACF